MEHLKPLEFVKQMVKEGKATEDTDTLTIMAMYHDYALEQAAEKVKAITREIKTDDPGSVFNSIPVYMGIDKQSILDLKINK